METFALATVHAAAHFAVIVGICLVAFWVNRRFLEGRDWYWLLWLLGLAGISFIVGKWLSGKIFGWSSFLACRWLDLSYNDAFSAMKLNSHRHFLRIRVLGDTLTVYPVKLDKVPSRGQWRANPIRDPQYAPSVFDSDPPIVPELVGLPIVVQAAARP